MTEEATTDSTTTAAPETTATEDASQTASAAESTDDLGVSVKLEDLPADVRKHVEKIEKDFKRAYTTKTQGFSSEKRELSENLARLKAEREQLESAFKDALSDPKKMESYKSILGVEKLKEPEFETVDDLVKWQKDQMASLEQRLVQQSEQKVDARLKAIEIENRWDKAALVRKEKDKSFARYYPLIENEILANKDHYSKMYTGKNEDAIYDLAYKKILSPISQTIEETTKTTKDVQQKKKEAASLTSTPATAGVTKGGGSAADIVARVRAKLGPNHLQK